MTSPNYGTHISSAFNAELEDVRQRVMAMGGLVETAFADAAEALRTADEDLARKVISGDAKINQLEVSIDDECSRILARRQPTASDLRLVYAVVKTITDIERMGDESEKIARMAADLAGHDRNGPLPEVGHLANAVAKSIRLALDAFARMDALAALQVMRGDAEIDREYEAIMRQCITFMMEDPRTIRRVMDMMWSVRSMERIGDHARNIAEYVIYFVKGKDVRHASMEEIEREVVG